MMDHARSDAMLADLRAFEHTTWDWPDDIMLAGGELYRRVMRAALRLHIKRGFVRADVRVRETTGGIGYRRTQLGAWLREVSFPQPRE